MRLCWLIPSDRSGGISPVSLSCCRQAAIAGYDVTMLMLLTPSWMVDNYNFKVASLSLYSSAPKAPSVLLKWLEANPQDVLLFNACGEFDPIIPYLHPRIKCIYVVHDTAPGYWHQAVEHEDNLEAIIAVSETVASKFRSKLKHPEKLSVIYNGCSFPAQPNSDPRPDELIFLGGDNPTKGSFDVLKLWKQLIELNFTGKLHWFGNLAPEFLKRIQQLPNSQQISIHGYVERDFIFATAASAKVLLMLSRVEPFGMSTIEAMSMGCVPVAWNVETGTKEIVTSQTGLFAPLGNIQILAKQVLNACDNYQQFTSPVMNLARCNFNESSMWSNYETLIGEICQIKLIKSSKYGQEPVNFQIPLRRFQLLPSSMRSVIREFVGRSPFLGYWLRDMRGW